MPEQDDVAASAAAQACPAVAHELRYTSVSASAFCSLVMTKAQVTVVLLNIEQNRRLPSSRFSGTSHQPPFTLRT